MSTERIEVAAWRPIGGGVYRTVGTLPFTSVDAEVRAGADPGPFSVELPIGQHAAAALEPGRLLTTTFRGDLRTWWVTQPEQQHEGADSTARIIGEDAIGMLATASAWPSPDKPIGQQITVAEGNYRGTAAKVATDLAAANLPRQGITFIHPPAEQLTWGSSIWSRLRFTPLLEEMRRVAERGGLTVRFGLRVSHPADTTARLSLWFERPRDLSAVRVELSPFDGSLASVSVVEQPPTITHAIVGGKGEGVGQFLLEHSTERSRADAARWGRRERYIDGPESFDEAPLREAAEDALWEGRARVTMNMEAAEPRSARAFEAFGPGDKIKVRLPSNRVVTDAISAVRFADDGSGPVVTPMFGDPDAAVGDDADAADAQIVAEVRGLRRWMQTLTINRKRGAV